MAQYESSPRTQFRRDVFLHCGDCGHVFINTTRTGTFCRRCRSVRLEVWGRGNDKKGGDARAKANPRLL